jgi:hypothetical protein
MFAAMVRGTFTITSVTFQKSKVEASLKYPSCYRWTTLKCDECLNNMRC